MDEKTKNLVSLSIAWLGPIWVISYLISWIGLGHNFPPPTFIGLTGQEFVDSYYALYQQDIIIGMTLSAAFGLLYLPWSCLLASLMNDSEGGMTVFVYMELAGGLLTGWVLGFCAAFWLACAVHATTMNPDIILMVHSFTWFIYDMTYMITTVQVTGFGLYIILNKKQTIFPAWLGWAAIAIGIVFVPCMLLPYFATGPFAVNGAWNFYIVFGTWGLVFFAPCSYFMLRELHARRQTFNA